MFVNVSWIQQHMPLPLWPVPGAVCHTKPHTHRVQSDTTGPTAVVTAWTRGTKASTHVQSMPIAVLPCRRATEAIGKWFASNSLRQLPASTRWCFAAVNCAVYLFPVFVIYPPTCVDLKPLPRMRNRKLTCCGLILLYTTPTAPTVWVLMRDFFTNRYHYF